jgi:hypothetical protein
LLVEVEGAHIIRLQVTITVVVVAQVDIKHPVLQYLVA